MSSDYALNRYHHLLLLIAYVMLMTASIMHQEYIHASAYTLIFLSYFHVVHRTYQSRKHILAD